MKQVVQSFKTGELAVQDVPPPSLRPRGVLVRTAASLVSAGTERSVVDFAEKNLLQKARARPDLVKQVVDKAQREGVLPTIEAVRNRLDQPLALGYSSAGTVVAVGAEAAGFRVGDRVACAGGGFAGHAELVYVPRTLAIPLPDGVGFEAGAFGALGAIALQGIRQAGSTIGDNVAVVGLGLLGQLTAQMLSAAGCRVFGVDLDPARVDLAETLGIGAMTTSGALDAGLAFSDGRGFDAVIITAATPSNDPVVLAGDLARDRAVVVAVGAVGLEIPRKVYYEKELDLRLSRSYGPGRYDPGYEEKGIDYPYGYVRWTEGRNIAAFLRLAAAGSVRVDPLITHRVPIDEAERAYDLIAGRAGEPFLGVILSYDSERPLHTRVALREAAPDAGGAPAAALRLGLLGAGGYVNATLLPALAEVTGLELRGIVSGSGLSARASGDRFGFAYAAADEAALLADPEIDWVAVVTRHDLHARQAAAALRAGKDVFVEKPLALDERALAAVAAAHRETGRRLMVGFNRRFAPMVRDLKAFLDGRRRPLVMTCRVNAGAVPASHWLQDPAVGGGRIVGEACHFVDLLQFLCGAPPTLVHALAVDGTGGPVEDEAILSLRFADGSVGTVVYAAGGDRAFPKERIEVIGDGRVATLDDYRRLDLVRDGKRRIQRERLRPDKGHRAEWAALVESARTGGPAPIPFAEIVAAHLATFAATASLREGTPVRIDLDAFWSGLPG